MAKEGWRTAIEARLGELSAAVAALRMEPPRDPAMHELPYHVNTLMQRAVMEFEAAFDRGLRYPEQWTDESRARVEAARVPDPSRAVHSHSPGRADSREHHSGPAHVQS